MITRCCKWWCHKYSGDEKWDAGHLGVAAGLQLSLGVKNDDGSAPTPECELAVILHAQVCQGLQSLRRMTF